VLQISHILLESPDIVAADEAHEMRNPNTRVCVALSKIRTKRRIALTGYPLQVRKPSVGVNGDGYKKQKSIPCASSATMPYTHHGNI